MLEAAWRDDEDEDEAEDADEAAAAAPSAGAPLIRRARSLAPVAEAGLELRPDSGQEGQKRRARGTTPGDRDDRTEHPPGGDTATDRVRLQVSAYTAEPPRAWRRLQQFSLSKTQLAHLSRTAH